MVRIETIIIVDRKHSSSIPNNLDSDSVWGYHMLIILQDSVDLFESCLSFPQDLTKIDIASSTESMLINICNVTIFQWDPIAK